MVDFILDVQKEDIHQNLKAKMMGKNHKGGAYIGMFILSAFIAGCTQVQNKDSKTADSTAYYTVDDFKSVEKFDTHIHINADDTSFIEQAKKDNFRLITVNVNTSYYPPIEEQQNVALREVAAFPEQIAYATTFDVGNWKDADWQQQVLAYLKESFEKGAIAVKVWKNIGMELKDENGKFVMIDNPRFDPILDYIEQNGITLIGHLGEPRNAWLPAEEMTIEGDREYFTRHPEYHMFLHQSNPSYEDQIAARDHMLEKHPNIRFVGAHLGSLEWSVDELAKHLDKFPNMAVDMAARISHLQYQSVSEWQKVHDFMIKYQDRIIYATDDVIMNLADSSKVKGFHEGWVRDWTYLTSDEKMTVPAVKKGSFNGLKLPKEVIDKIYRKNAEQWFPKLAQNK